jgi:hypothetical protein
MIAQRADEPLQVFAAYMSLFGKPLPNSLKRGLADALAKKNEWEHVRYSVGGPGVHPSTKDMFLMIAREGDWPVSKELFEYLVNDNIVNPEKTPIAAARKALVDCKDFNSAKELILKARAPWEVVLSQFGNKKEVWEFMIDNNLVGYMAPLRNLRNIEDIKISDSHKKIVKDKLVNGAVSSKQLPFRFLAARKNTTQNWTASAIDLAFNESVANVPIIPGKTLVIMDRSGSMNCLVSGKSQMTCKEVAATLGAILAKRMGTDNVTLYAFADRCAEIKFSDADSVMNIVDNINKTYVGGSTYAQLPVLEAIQKGAKFDRMILLSDMQCYTETSRYRRDNQIVYLDQALNEYRNRVNHDVFMHSIDLQSYGTSQLNPKDKKVQLIGGWSESVFNLITTFEGAEIGTGIPTIEELRKRYSLIKD